MAAPSPKHGHGANRPFHCYSFSHYGIREGCTITLLSSSAAPRSSRLLSAESQSYKLCIENLERGSEVAKPLGDVEALVRATGNPLLLGIRLRPVSAAAAAAAAAAARDPGSRASRKRQSAIKHGREFTSYWPHRAVPPPEPPVIWLMFELTDKREELIAAVQATGGATPASCTTSAPSSLAAAAAASATPPASSSSGWSYGKGAKAAAAGSNGNAQLPTKQERAPAFHRWYRFDVTKICKANKRVRARVVLLYRYVCGVCVCVLLSCVAGVC